MGHVATEILKLEGTFIIGGKAASPCLGTAEMLRKTDCTVASLKLVD
jgi:hypothetical protein